MSARVARLIGWWVVLGALFTVLTGEWTDADIVGGAAAGFVAAAAAAILQRRRLVELRVRPRWLPRLAPVARQLFVDFGIIAGALGRCLVRGRRETGAFVARRIDVAGTDPVDVSWRAFLAYAATVSPNSYVIDIDEEQQRRLNHDLVPHAPSEAPA